MTLMATAKKATATKVAAKKAPVKKPSPGVTPPPKGAVLATGEANQTTGRTIEFLGRTIAVDLPDAGQLVVWQKILDQIQNEADTKDSQRVMILARRGMKIVESIMPRKEDHEWIDDALLDKRADLRKVLDIIVLAVRAYAPDAEIPSLAVEIE